MPQLKSENDLDDYKSLKALFDMASDGIIMISDKGVIERVNPAASKLFGYTQEELIGHKVNILMPDHHSRQHDQYIERYQKTRVPHIIGIGREVKGIKKDGTTIPLRLSVSEVELEGRTSYTGILHDISAIKKAQEEIKNLNEALENKVKNRTAALREREIQLQDALGKERELNQLKSRFLSMASHEFKTPLSTVLSSIEILEMYTQGNPRQDKCQKHTSKIKKAVNQLTDILNDFLSLSRLEHGKIHVQRSYINMRAIVASSIEASEGQYRKDQEVLMELDEDPADIMSDPRLLKNILINLLSNAAKYSHEGSTIRIRGHRKNNNYLLYVIDEGIGIPEIDQTHLFDRFHRAQNVENIPGTGLGLNIVKHYVDLLEGSISFTSKLNSGTTFVVTLPLNDKS